jgi:hypothetical protein
MKKKFLMMPWFGLDKGGAMLLPRFKFKMNQKMNPGEAVNKYGCVNF